MTLLFKLALLLVAFLYATVGHGGASGYLAVFALASLPPGELRASALILNLFVSALSFISYRSRSHFDHRIFTILILSSVPAAYAGGLFHLPGQLYKFILGTFLLFAFLKVSGLLASRPKEISRMPVWAGILMGLLIGFFSGLIGIGGGIILSPLLILFAWADMKTTAGISAAFIFINSAAGLAGLFHSGQMQLDPELPVWIGLVLVGGLAGSILGSRVLSEKGVRKVLALVLALASFKLLFL